MAESTLTCDREYLLREVGRLLGWDRTVGNWDDDQDTDGDDFVQSGLRSFYYPPSGFLWSFLRDYYTITTVAEFSADTITVSSGVVTKAAGTNFPSWAASGEITLSGLTYTVNTRDGNNQVTLDDTSLTNATASSYVLGQSKYDLPDNFAGFISPMTYRPGASSYYPPIAFIDEFQIRGKRQDHEIASRPMYCALSAKTFNPTTGQRWEVQFWPTPDDVWQLTGRMKIIPDKLTSVNKYPLGGGNHSETILESVLAAAERKMEDSEGLHAQAFSRLLESSINQDRETTRPGSLGVDYGDSSGSDDYDGIYMNPYGGYTQYTGQTLFTG